MQALFRWLTDRAMAESIAGDLEEQRRHRRKRSWIMAELWFWRRTAAMALYFGRTQMQTILLRMFPHDVARTGGFRGDLKYAARALRRSPWYAATVIGVVALGMTLATTVFAIVDGVLFRPLPYPHAERLVTIEPGVSGVDRGKSVTMAGQVDFANWQAQAPDVSFTAFNANRWAGLGEGVNESPYGMADVLPNFFDTIGVHPLAGGLTAADFDHADIVKPVVITYDLWQTRFHGMTDVVGQQFIGDSTKGWGFRVVGVMPRGFVFPSSRAAISFITPMILDPKTAADPKQRRFVEVIARRPSAMTLDGLRARVEAGMKATAAVFPALGPKPQGWSDKAWRLQGPYDRADVMPLSTTLGRDERPLFAAVFLAAVILLAMGGLNVSGLMAARGMDRARELGLRRALGASGAAIARLVFLEAAMPITIGSLAGLAIAAPLLRLGARLLPEEIVLLKPQLALTIDLRVALFVIVSALVLALPATIWPIRRAIGARANALSEGGRGSTGSRSIGRAVVIASQVAGALVLTLGGALLVSSILRVYAHTRPIQTDDVVVIQEWLLGPGAMMGKSPERTARMNRLIDTLRRIPGVDSVALSDAQVLAGDGAYSFFIEPPAARRVTVGMHSVTSDFYKVLRPQLIIGRYPTDAELTTDAPVIVVSEALARAYWPGASPIGQTLADFPDKTPFTVVGVVKDVRWGAWDTDIASIYAPYAKLSHFPFPTVFIRTRMSAAEMTAKATEAVAAVDPLMTTRRAGSLDDWFADSVRPRRFQAWLFGSFAVAALVIVGAGILGLMAMSTARRTREMGIRLALGSTREGLVRLLLREQFLQVASGVVVGSLFSAWAVRFVRANLYEVTPYDPRVWAAAIGVIVATTAIGTLIPSWRASKTDPVHALRVE